LYVRYHISDWKPVHTRPSRTGAKARKAEKKTTPSEEKAQNQTPIPNISAPKTMAMLSSKPSKKTSIKMTKPTNTIRNAEA
jgi:hypothetical protein